MYRLVASIFVLTGILGSLYFLISDVLFKQTELLGLDNESFSSMRRDSTDFVIIDVRTESEWDAEASPFEGALNIPLLELEKRYAELNVLQGRPILVVCPTGSRSRQGARILRAAGFDASFLEQGTGKLFQGSQGSSAALGTP